MSLRIVVVSDKKALLDMRNRADAFLVEHSLNPFLLFAFLERQFKDSSSSDSIPTVLFFFIQDELVGVVPLLIKRRLGVQSARFLSEYSFSPDFVFNDRYRADCMESCLTFIFDQLSCKLASFDLPLCSPNLPFLRRLCRNLSVTFRPEFNDSLSHATIASQSTWETFEKLKGSHFRKEMRQIGRRLAKAGTINTQLYENWQDDKIVLDQILEIERKSWKENWRWQQDPSAERLDSGLLNIYDFSIFASSHYLDFKRIVWFLYLDGEPIAYNFAIQYKDTAYLVKTSFKEHYRNCYPGVYLNNVVIRDLFNFGNVRVIDFMTNLHVHGKWATDRQVRVKLLLAKGFLPNLYNSVMKLPQIRKVMAIVVGLFRLDV